MSKYRIIGAGRLLGACCAGRSFTADGCEGCGQQSFTQPKPPTRAQIESGVMTLKDAERAEKAAEEAKAAGVSAVEDLTADNRRLRKQVSAQADELAVLRESHRVVEARADKLERENAELVARNNLLATSGAAAVRSMLSEIDSKQVLPLAKLMADAHGGPDSFGRGKAASNRARDYLTTLPEEDVRDAIASLGEAA